MLKFSFQHFFDQSHRSATSFISPFYRAYPYTGHLPFPRADARGAVSADDKFFYNRVPKVANSTILTTLAILSAEANKKVIVGDPKFYFPRPTKISYRIAKKIKSDYFKFTFVRNPYTRTLSAYLDKIVGGKNRIWERWAERNHTRSVPSFVEFCRYLQRTGRYDDAHWAPQVDCMLIPINHFDFIGKFEFLSRDLENLISKIFPENAGRIENAGPSPTRAHTKMNQYYDAECIEIIKNIYSVDFETFNYEKEFNAAI